jgi:hypothetical protein
MVKRRSKTGTRHHMSYAYAPCADGVHICGIARDEEAPHTVANLPGAGGAFAKLALRYALPDDAEPDFVVDLMVGDECVADFKLAAADLEMLLADVGELA